jgi:hypothetical protein
VDNSRNPSFTLTHEQVQELVELAGTLYRQATAELGTGVYPSLPASKLSAFRGTTARAFAARAAAALRTGTLAEAVRAGVAYRVAHDVTPPAWSRLSAADLAAHQHIEDQLESLSYPERPDDPDDEPVIESLLAGSKGNEYAMLPALAVALWQAGEAGTGTVDELALARQAADREAGQ